jgi:proteic killer suppression protein
VIKTISGSATQQFAEFGKSKFSGLDEPLAQLRLKQIGAATSLENFGQLKSVGLHKLKGPLRNFWSINVNGPWRIIFKFEHGDAYEVQIIDTH